MAREEYDIVVKTSGTREVQRDLAAIAGAAKDATNFFARMQNTMAFAFTTFGLNTLRQYVDGFSDMTSRLRIATDGVEELSRAEDQLFKISQRTYSGLSETVDLYTRLERSTRELGISQDNLLQVTEAVSKAVQLSGASAQAANASIIQLGQGLASGALRGDELRSILEQTPALAQAIASGMGVAVGELKSLGTQGALTTDVVLNAIAKSTAGIDAEFSNVILTISKGWTTLNNSILKGIGELDRNLGVSGSISRGLSWIAYNLGDIGDAALVASAGIALLYAPSLLAGLRAATLGVKALTVAIASNPLGAIAVGVTAAVTALTLFRDEIQPIEGSIVSLRDLTDATFNVLGPKISAFANKVKEGFSTFVQENEGIIEAFGNSAVNVWNMLLGFGKNMLNFYSGMTRFLMDLPGAVIKTWRDNISQGLDNMSSLFGGFMTDLQEIIDGDFSFDKFLAAKDEATGGFSSMFSDIDKLATSAFSRDYFDETISGIKELSTTASRSMTGALEEIRQEAERVAAERVAGEETAQASYLKTDKILNGVAKSQTQLGKEAEKAAKLRAMLLNELQGFENNFSYEREIEAINNWAFIQKEKLKEVGSAHGELAGLIAEVQAKKIEEAYRKSQEQLEAQAEAANRLRGSLLSDLQGFENNYSYDREIEAINNWAEAQTKSLKDVGEAHEELATLIADVQAKKIEEAYRKMLDNSTEFSAGVERLMLDWSSQVVDYASLAENSIDSFANNGANAIVQFAKTGKLSFGDFAEAVATDILMMTTRMLMMRAIMSTIGFMGGGSLLGDGTSLGLGNTVYAANGTNGPITGYGTSTSDSIPAMLSKGEWVIDSKTAKANESLLWEITKGAKRFNAGGPVSGGMPTGTPAGPHSGKMELNMPTTIIIEGDASEKTVEEIQRAVSKTKDDVIAEITKRLATNGDLAAIVRSIR